MPSAPELIAHGRDVREIEREIGADWLIYQDLEDLRAATQGGEANVTTFEDSVFSGQYLHESVDANYLTSLESTRSDTVRTQADAAVSEIEEN